MSLLHDTVKIGKYEVLYEPKFVRSSDLLRRREILKEQGWQEVLGCYICLRHIFKCDVCNSKDCPKRPGWKTTFNLRVYPLTYCRKHPRYYVRFALIKEV